MDKKKQISELAEKALSQRDERLLNFFDDEVLEESSGLIFNELKNLGQGYTDKTEVCRGGMKIISRVLDVKGNRYLAMAELIQSKNKELYESFLREARLTALLDHPNIISIHEIGLNESQLPYFTMDLKHGDDLEALLKKVEAKDTNLMDPYQREDFLLVFQKICNAIDYAHSKSILHLDLKPENIQVGDFGEVLVCDWGLSKVVGSSEHFLEGENRADPDLLNDMTQHGTIKGTPGYMAPEQIVNGEKTEQTDVFALGCMLYRICAGRSAFRGDLKQVLHKTLKGDYIGLKEIDKTIPMGLVSIAEKAMQVDILERYKSVEEMNGDLRKYLAGYATEAENASALRLMHLLYQRNKSLVYLVASFLILASFGLSVFIQRISEERAIAVVERDRAKQAKGRESLARQEAEHNFKEAEDARALAERNAQLLAEEKDHLEKLNTEYVSDLVRQSVFISDNMNFWELHNDRLHKKTLLYLDRAISLNNDAKSAWKQKGHLLFIMQRYRDAKICFEQVEGFGEIKQICSGFSGRRSKDSIESFLEVIKKLGALQPRPSYRGIIDQMISYDVYAHERSLNDKIALTKLLVEMWHPNSEVGFEFNPDLRELTLSGEGINYLRFERNPSGKRRSILWLLKPKVLVFENTQFKQLAQLFDLPLVKLDLRGSVVKDLSSLKNFTSLERIIVNEGQFTKTQLKSLPEWIKLTKKLPEDY